MMMMIPSLLSCKAAQSQGAQKTSEGLAAASSHPQGEQPPPEKTQSGAHQTLNLSTSSDYDQLPISTILPFKPSTSTSIQQTKES